MEIQTNNIHLVGTVLDEPKITHEVMDEKFYEFNLGVGRVSGKYDILPVVLSERLYYNTITKDSCVEINGEIRTRNEQDTTSKKSKLKISIFVREIGDAVEYLANEVCIRGFVCKEPVYRVTPFVREECDVLRAVNRRTNKSDYIPCIAWGRNAKFMKEVPIGKELTFTGRMQSRTYEKKHEDGSIENKVAYEMSIARIKEEVSEN